MDHPRFPLPPVILLTLLSALTRGAPSEGPAGATGRGDEFFRAGHFAQTEQACGAALADGAADGHAVLRLGEVTLHGNPFEEAQRHLERATELLPDDKRPRSLLAERLYRQDRFEQAASIYREIGPEAAANQLAAFAGRTPYELQAAGIDLNGRPSFQGMGGGGPVTVTPFDVHALSLGDARQENITGMYGGRPPETEYRHGFRIGGVISHAFFRPCALTFDFDGMRMYLDPGK